MAETSPSLRARLHYAWGQSCAYWGNRMVSRTMHERAVRAWTRARELAPDWAAPLLRRATIKGRELGDYPGACEDLAALIAADPEWPEPYLRRGLLSAFQGPDAIESAIDDLERFLFLAPAHHWRADAERTLARLRSDAAELAAADPASFAP